MDDGYFTSGPLPDDEAFPSPVQPHIQTLFAEFARTRPRASSPRPTGGSAVGSASRRSRTPPENSTPTSSKLDLRALDYVSDYDSHLMCPICHVPFLDPVVLECDHTFCQACLTEYRDGLSSPTCPTCRTLLLSPPRKASRLIVNMCNDISVRCPNQDCQDLVPRGRIESHATKECPHEQLPCPGSECGKTVKRKNFVPDQCIHTSHIECDCGVIIELGRGEWLRHKDEECPNTGVKCDKCDQRISAKDYVNGATGHICNEDESTLCPGRPFGCTGLFDPEQLEIHTQSCSLARLAPYLNKQSHLLQSLQEQLAMTKIRNEVLENGFDKINDIVNDRVLPYIHFDQSPPGEASDIEEIERDHIPSAISHRDLLMPAHLRALTPSPDPEAASISQTQQHLLALHESLRTNVTTLEHDISNMSNAISDLDARTSMQLMNETLRIKEDLAHTNAALFSTRAQVQWLLNRERVGQQQQAMMRGRTPSTQPQGQNVSQSTRSSISEGNDPSAQQSNSEPHPSASSLGQSPVFRPQNRRLSGGSQERVKL